MLALGSIGNKKAIEPLKKFLKSSDRAARISAKIALRHIKEGKSVTKLNK